MSLSTYFTHDCITVAQATDLEGQQAFVYLGSLQTSLPVGTRCVGASLVPCEVDERELPVHLPLPSKDDLEYGVAPR